MFCEAKIDRQNGIIEFLSGLSKSAGGWIFRGHADAKWPLDTNLRRTAVLYKIDPRILPIAEHQMLEIFKRRAHHYLQHIPGSLDDIEWLSILQHHGCTTRLLDFTYSFYIALFFAVELAWVDACVWCISSERLRSQAITLLDNIELIHARSINVSRDIMIYEGRGSAEAFVGRSDVGNMIVIPVTPYRFNERMSIQQGIFMFPTNMAVSFEDNLLGMFEIMAPEPINWLTDYWNKCSIIKLTIPAMFHKEILEDLHSMNITAASLFPGLDGFARSLRFSLRKMDYYPNL